jgi:catechol 2,3-dioxygenase-like lactoylglutathione lyase family enzyme
MKVVEIAFSCYPVTDMSRARAFYEGVLGLTATMDHQMEGDHWVEHDIGAGTLAIANAPGIKPSLDGCSVALEVDDFDKAIAELKAAGVAFNFGPLETSAALAMITVAMTQKQGLEAIAAPAQIIDRIGSRPGRGREWPRRSVQECWL